MDKKTYTSIRKKKMAQSLAVKYRPKTWDEVVGQDTIVTILKRQLQVGEIKNCLLFCGTSGGGKTTCARIYAKEINKGVGNPIEIDAASNNGVDNVRVLVAQAKERAIDGEYKVFIIDECHVLSNQAWQAWLKCIEEPPKYTIFIFCTTDPQKIPETILNRVQRYNFSRISTNQIRDRLEYVCRCEGFTNYKESIEYIAKLADGGMRMSLALLDKCATYSKDLSIQNVLSVLGNCSYDMFFDLVNAIIDREERTISKIVNDYYNSGADIMQFVEQFLVFCLDLQKYQLFSSMELLTIPSHYENNVKYSINFDDASKFFIAMIDKLLDLKNTIKYDTNPKLVVEITLLQMARN